MSGVIGYKNRIKREEVNKILDNYSKILYKFGKKYYKDNYKGFIITGSYNNPLKNDFGDIDLILIFEGLENSKAIRKEIKDKLSKFLEKRKEFIKFIGKYSGKKSHKAGELVSVAYNYNNKPIQIDNIISLSLEESNFKNKFLSLGAIKQGLLLGLVKIYYDNLMNEDVSLSSRGLKIKSNYGNIFYNPNWEKVENIIKYYENNYNIILNDLDTYKNIEKLSERDIRRISGMFLKMVTVKTGELNTEKGIEKQKWINFFKELKDKYEEKTNEKNS